MTKNFIIKILIAIMLISIIICFYLKDSKESPLDTTYKYNVVGNDTNNIKNLGGIISTQDEWFYYYYSGDLFNSEGLYRSKKDGTNKALMVKGFIVDINVVGDYVYYVTVKPIIDDDWKYVGYYQLYKIKLDGTENTKILDHAVNVSILNDNIYYIIGIDTLGIANYSDSSFDNEKKGYIAMCDLNGKNCQYLVEKDTNSMLVENSKIYYDSDNKVYYFDLNNRTETFLFETDSRNSYYALSNDSIIFYKNDGIYKYYLDGREIEILLKEINNISWLNVVGNNLYFNDGTSYNGITKIYVLNLENSHYSYKSMDNFGKVFSLDNKPYILDENKIYELTFD